MEAPIPGYVDSPVVPCDLCGATEAVEVPHAREYTADQPIHICVGCGFVHVKERRSAEEIAASWTEEIFGAGYTAAIPAVTARLTYVAETVDLELGLRGRRVCEIGAGEGHFLDLLRGERYGADVFGIEPSAANCSAMSERGIDCFNGTIEDWAERGEPREFDLVAILWTLENCRDCVGMLRAARGLLGEGGRVVVATGSRILVPFKKSLDAYLSTNPADTHSFRFSAATLRGALAVAGLETAYVNRYVDHDVLLVLGAPEADVGDWQGDDYLDVWNFFERWHVDTAVYWPAGA